MNKNLTLFFFLLYALTASAQLEVGVNGGLRMQQYSQVNEPKISGLDFSAKMGYGASLDLKYCGWGPVNPVLRLDYSTISFYDRYMSGDGLGYSITDANFSYGFVSAALLVELKPFGELRLCPVAGYSAGWLVAYEAKGTYGQGISHAGTNTYEEGPFRDSDHSFVKHSLLAGLSYTHALSKTLWIQVSGLHSTFKPNLTNSRSSLRVYHLSEFQLGIGVCYRFGKEKQE